MPTKTFIPVELVTYVIHKGLVPEFRVLVAAKIITPGYISEKGDEFTDFCRFLGNDKRTVKKHLRHLLKIGWAGIDGTKRKYYIRSWDQLCKKIDITNHRSVVCEHKFIKNFHNFLVGSILGDHILKQKHYWQAQKRKLNRLEQLRIELQRNQELGKSVVIQKRTTSQDQLVSTSANYNPPECFGLSNLGISNLLGYSQSYARRRKQGAEKAGFIKTRSRENELKAFSEFDGTIRANYAIAYGSEYAQKLRFKSIVRDGRRTIILFEQLYDEIIPKLVYVKVNHKKRMLRKENQIRQSQYRKRMYEMHSLPGSKECKILQVA